MTILKAHVRLKLLSLGLFVLIFLSGAYGLAKFITVDEPAWILFTSNFFVGLYRGDFEKAIIDYGVMTMWVLTLAFMTYFRGYRAIAKYTDKYWQVEAVFDHYHKDPLALLVRGRMISLVFIAGMLTLSFNLLNFLTGTMAALAAMLIVAFDPYFLGNSRVLNHEGLMAGFILVCILSLLVFCYKRRQVRFLILSAVAGGLALETKSPAIVLIPLVVLILFVRYLEDWKTGLRQGRVPLVYVRYLALWLGLFALTFFILYPGMWVKPGDALYEVFGNALSNALMGGRLATTQELQVYRFGLEPSGVVFYLKAMILKTTPVVWAGVLLAFFGMGAPKVRAMSALSKLVVAYFWLLAIGFVLMFGIFRGTNHIHYVLTSFVALDVIAGIGIGWGIGWLAGKYPVLQKTPSRYTLLVVVLLLHAAGALPQYPYYYTYTNPIAQRLMLSFRDPVAGYGEGLELAAAYLAQKPDAENMKVMSWYEAGPFSYFFPGTTYSLTISTSLEKEYVDWLKDSDYLVIYPLIQEQLNMPAKLLRELQSYKPEHVVWINGLEYVRIYRVNEFSAAFFAAILD